MFWLRRQVSPNIFSFTYYIFCIIIYFFQISNVENLSPQIIRRVAKEMSELASQPPEGIRVVLNEEDVTDIQAIIEGPCKIKSHVITILVKFQLRNMYCIKR